MFTKARVAAVGAVALVACMASAGCSAGNAAGAAEAAPSTLPAPSPPVVTVGTTFHLSGIKDFRKVAKLTGPGAINHTEKVAVAGTDLGWQMNVGDRTYFVFGDTFGHRDPGAEGGVGTMWRSNVAAYSTDTTPKDGITFDGWITDDTGQASALVEGDHQSDATGEVTKIPTYGFAIGDTMYLHFMSIYHWGPAGSWDVNYSALAKSTDKGKTWQVLNVKWPADSNFAQVATAQVMDGGKPYIYLWGIPSGRSGSVKLARVPATTADVERQASYQYFTGTDASGGALWSTDIAKAKVVMAGPCGEFSVSYSPYLHNWILAQYNDGTSTASIREGLSPWGPWGKAYTFADQASIPGLYAPFLNPKYTSDGGSTVYFTMSQWGPYNVSWYSLKLRQK